MADFHRIDELVTASLARMLGGDAAPITYKRAHDLAESPLEARFWHLIINRTDVRRWDRVVPQYKVGGRRLDSLFVSGGHALNIELDGKAYHDWDTDLDRDLDLLQRGAVSEVIRIPYAAMMFYEDAVMQVLGEWHDRLKAHGGRPVFCVTPEELKREIASIKESSATANHGLDDKWIKDTYDVFATKPPDLQIRYGIFEQEGIACGPFTAPRRDGRMIRRWMATPQEISSHQQSQSQKTQCLDRASSCPTASTTWRF